jgi:hypothetical protein
MYEPARTNGATGRRWRNRRSEMAQLAGIGATGAAKWRNRPEMAQPAKWRDRAVMYNRSVS